VIHFFDPAKLASDRPIPYESKGLVEAILDLSLARKHQSSTEQETNLYADGERVASSPAENQPSPVARSGSPIPGPEAEADGVFDKPSSSEGSSASIRSQSDSEQQSSATSITSVESAVQKKQVTSEDIHTQAEEIWARLAAATGRTYRAFEYTGAADAQAAVFAFGADAALLGEELGAALATDVYRNCGLITVRLYRPWLGRVFTQFLPSSLKRIGVLEQNKRKTTKWGPMLLDILTSYSSGSSTVSTPLIVGYQLGYLEPSTIRQALNGVFSNLLSDTPIQNLEVGTSATSRLALHKQPHEQPKLENAYMKILTQVFKERLNIANRLGANNAGISSQMAANPEFGFGSILARIERRQKFVQEVQAAAKTNDFTTKAPLSWLSRWTLDAEDPNKCNAAADEALARLATDGSPAARQLLSNKSLFRKESQWLVGSDAWAYDLGNSGVHHVLASGKNVNMLIVDSTPYSDRNKSDANRRKKDIGLYAMNFGNAYVASVAVYSSYTQVLEAMMEADKFDGPSVVLAYLPYNKEDETPLTVLQETKKAVDAGYWPLYRWTPAVTDDGEPSFQLDSERIKRELEEFLARDNQLTQLMRRQPAFASNLSASYGSEVRDLQKRKAKDAYSKLLDGLFGAPLTILFASDNGNAENVAKRLGNRGKARGLKTMVMAMDDYPIEDLSGEENVALITATAGQGEFPQNGRNFWEHIKSTVDMDLATVHFAVFALGDSHYWPRKEDRIYYNKPGKDLDAKLRTFGGKPMTDCGLGDDQEPDGYQTGYNLWEPELWKALGVDQVEGLPEEPAPITNEDIKIASNYLRGTIAEGLEDQSTGAIDAADQQLTKFHGTYMQDDRDLREQRKAEGLEPAYSFMIRCRLAGGVSTPEQWLLMDDVSSTLGNETMKMTTRQTFQFHGIVKGKLRPAMQAINKALMTTLAACGDVNRNVMCSPNHGNAAFHKEVHEVAKLISDYLLPSAAANAYHEIWLKTDDDQNIQVAGKAVTAFEEAEPLYGPVYLPRKFKVTIAIPPHNDTDVYAHDVGLIAIMGDDGKLAGFNVLAGGGMGVTHNNKKTYPRTGSMMGFVTPDKAHIATKHIMFVQRDHGDRKNRKHARLKYTIDDMGVDVFRSKVEESWGEKFGEERPFHFDSNVDSFGWHKDETGKWHFTMFIENGRIEDTADFPMKTGLREIAKVHKGDFTLTPNQHLILSNVHEDQLQEMKDMLKKYKLDNTDFSGLRLSSSACVAFPTCGLAMAESERYLPVMVSKVEKILEENGLRQDSIVMRMTGCPNGCARPWLAEVAFVGKAFGAYNMMLGGGYHGQRLNKLYRGSIKEDEILEIMRPMIKRYAIERNEGEHFGDFVIRAGYIKPTTEGKTFHEDTAEVEEED